MLVACRLAGLSALEAYYAGVGGFILAGQVREPRPAWPREILSAVALGQRHQNVRQGRVRAEPREQAVKTISSPLARSVGSRCEPRARETRRASVSRCVSRSPRRPHARAGASFRLRTTTESVPLWRCSPRPSSPRLEPFRRCRILDSRRVRRPGRRSIPSVEQTNHGPLRHPHACALRRGELSPRMLHIAITIVVRVNLAGPRSPLISVLM
jgi:hypothetical protein